MKYTASQRELLFKKVIKELQSGRPLREILNDKGTPSRTALYDWLDKDRSYQERFARAMELGDEVLFEETLQIARTPLPETIYERGVNGLYEIDKRTTKDNVQRSKLMIETIDKVLARRNPRKYGTKLDVTSGGDPLAVPAIIGMTIKNEITPTADEPIDEDDLN